MTADRHKVLGIAFIGVLVLPALADLRLLRKVFTETVDVTLKTSHIGLQLNKHADVKLRGIIVGEVRDVSTDGDGATVELSLKPEQVGRDPSASAPGSCRRPCSARSTSRWSRRPAPQGRPIKAGDVIARDRTAVGIEIEKVLNDALPLLQARRPGRPERDPERAGHRARGPRRRDRPAR